MIYRYNPILFRSVNAFSFHYECYELSSYTSFLNLFKLNTNFKGLSEKTDYKSIQFLTSFLFVLLGGQRSATQQQPSVFVLGCC